MMIVAPICCPMMLTLLHLFQDIFGLVEPLLKGLVQSITDFHYPILEDYFTYIVVAFHTKQNNQLILLWLDDFNSFIIVASYINWKHTYQQLRCVVHFLPLLGMIQ